jgi:hypothetical protein
MQGSRIKVMRKKPDIYMQDRIRIGSKEERRGLLREIGPGYMLVDIYRRAAKAARAAAAKRVLPANFTLEAAPGNDSGGLVELAGGAPGTELLAGGA